MRKVVLLALTAAIAAPAATTFAAGKGERAGRQLCILYTEMCSGKMQAFQKKIEKIQDDLAKRATVYRPEEVDKLEMKLKEAEEQMDRVLSSSESR